MTDLKSNKKRKGHPQVINPVGEFCLPVTLPEDPEWVAAFIGAVRKLSNRSTWDYDDNEDYIVLAERWNEIADMIQNAYAGGMTCAIEAPEEGAGCVEIGAFHPAVRYYPNHPILTPDYAPEYGDFPVWVTGAGFGPLSNPNDAQFNPLATINFSDIISIFEDGPKIELHFSGAGEIDIQFLQMPLGGYAIVYPDNNPLLADFIDLAYVEWDGETIPDSILGLIEFLQGDQDNEYVHTINFATGGPHVLTIHIVPIQDNPPYIGVSGGLRSFDVCGEIDLTGEVVVPYTLEPTGDGSIVLLADGVPASTVDLKALLDDDYVNVEGDTMVGQLAFELPNGQDGRKPLTFRENDIDVAQIETNGGAHLFQYFLEPNTQWSVNRNADGWQWALSLGYMQFVAGSSANGAGVNGSFRYRGYHPNMAMGVKNAHPSAPYIGTWIDNTGVMRQAASMAGALLGRAMETWDYSSTSVWHRLSALRGEFTVSNEANWSGGFVLEVENYVEARPIIRSFYGEPPSHLVPSLAFFEGDGFVPTGIPNRGGDSVANQLAYALGQYGLILPFSGTEAPPLPPATWERCNAAWYVAQAVSDLVSNSITDLQSFTVAETLSGVLDDIGVELDLTVQFLAWLYLNDSQWDDIQDDLALGVDDLAEQLYTNGFERDTIQTWLETYIGWNGVTNEAVTRILDAVLPRQWDAWIQIGGQTENDNECFEPLPCDDIGFTDFRYTLGGWHISNGSRVQSSGIESADDGTNIYAQAHIYADDCDKLDFTATWWAESSDNDDLTVRRQEWNGTNWVTTEFHTLSGSGAGPNSGSDHFNPGGSGVWVRAELQTQAQASGFDLQSKIITFEFTD